jgi:hypothetical protein
MIICFFANFCKILALIENIISVPDFAAGPSGLPNVSLLIQTSHRQLKLTAPTQEKHDLWFEVTHTNNEKAYKDLKYFVSRPCHI